MWLTYDRASLISDAANVVLLVSLAVGVVASLIVFWMGNLKEGLLRSDVAAANEAAERAKIDSAAAKDNAAAAQAELIRIREPRTLNSQQKDLIAQQVAVYAGQEFSGLVASGVPDAMPLWQSITTSLSAAGWKLLPPAGLAVGQPPAGVPVAPEVGITILVHVDAAERLRPVTTTLSSALSQHLNSVRIGLHKVSEKGRESAIVIEIGTKP